jgi:hypothetical protein
MMTMNATDLTVATLCAALDLTEKVQQVTGEHWPALANLPVRFFDSKSDAGSWNPLTKILSLNRALQGDDLADSFLHELAHAWVAMQSGRLLPPPHGPQWRRLAKLLGANPRATNRYKSLELDAWARDFADLLPACRRAI